MSNCLKDKDLVECLIVRSYVWMLRAPKTVNGQRLTPLWRHGFYEIRLLEPSDLARDDGLPFWVELFDTRRKLSLDSYGGDDVEEAAGAVQHLISHAELLATEPAIEDVT